MSSPARWGRARRSDHAAEFRLASGVLVLLAVVVFALDPSHPAPVTFTVIVLALLMAEIIWT